MKKNDAKEINNDKKIHNNLTTSLDEFQKKITTSLEPVVTFEKTIKKEFEPVKKQLFSLSEFIENSLNDLFSFLEKNWECILPKISEYLQTTSDSLEKFKLISLDIGLPPHYDLELDFINEVVKIYDNEGKNKAKEFYETYLIKNFNTSFVNKVYNKWNKIDWLEEHLNDLKSGINCHNNGNYTAAITTLMPKLEGFIAKHYCQPGQEFKQRDLKRSIRNMLNKQGTLNFDQTIKKYYLEVILAKFYHGDPIPDDLNRHAILHGAASNYGNKINSLKLIFLLNYIIKRLNEK